jgi:ribosome-associated protein
VISSTSPHKSEALANRVGELILDKKGEDVLLLDLRALTTVCDWFVVATVDSEPQMKAVVTNIKQGDLGEDLWHVEGLDHGHWVVLDYVDVVVHLFKKGVRENYALERLWGDAPRKELSGGREGS